MKNKKILVKVVTSCIALVAMFFISAGNTYAATASIIVGGEDISTSSGTKSNAASTATWDASNSTLKLNGYTGTTISISGTDAATIELTGANTITESEYGIDAGSAIEITGTGTLTVTSTKDCIRTTKSNLYGREFSLRSATLKLNCARVGIESGTAHIYSGAINYYNTQSPDSWSSTNMAIYTYHSVIIDDGSFSTTGSIVHTIVPTNGDITINGGTFNKTNNANGSLFSAQNALTINGGTINSNNAGFVTWNGGGNHDITINNGTINIKNTNTPIETYSGNIIINGGKLTLGATYTGINQLSNSDAGVQFNGGYTKITTSGIGSTVSARGSSKITLGDDMRILENNVILGENGGYYTAQYSSGGSAKVTTICPASSSECEATSPVVDNNPIDTDPAATTTAAKEIVNPDTADSLLLYSLIAAGIASLAVLARRYYVKH